MNGRLGAWPHGWTAKWLTAWPSWRTGGAAGPLREVLEQEGPVRVDDEAAEVRRGPALLQLVLRPGGPEVGLDRTARTRIRDGPARAGGGEAGARLTPARETEAA